MLTESLKRVASGMTAPDMRHHSPCQRRDPLSATLAKRARWSAAALAPLPGAALSPARASMIQKLPL